jgi:hypothetical protein
MDIADIHTPQMDIRLLKILRNLQTIQIYYHEPCGCMAVGTCIDDNIYIIIWLLERDATPGGVGEWGRRGSNATKLSHHPCFKFGKIKG